MKTLIFTLNCKDTLRDVVAYLHKATKYTFTLGEQEGKYQCFIGESSPEQIERVQSIAQGYLELIAATRGQNLVEKTSEN